MHNSRSLAKKVLLLINPGFRNKEFILKRMKELGVIVVTVHDKKLDWAQPYVDHWVIVEKQDPEQMIMEKIDHLFRILLFNNHPMVNVWLSPIQFFVMHGDYNDSQFLHPLEDEFLIAKTRIDQQ